MKYPKRLVIDTSIARSAGETNYPESRDCRAILTFIQKYCHSFVMTEAIKEEWNIHASRYARRWLVRMTRTKGKVFPLKVPSGKLRNKIDSSCPGKRRDAVGKDTFLIEAAFYADKIIVSKDSTALKDFASISSSVDEVAGIYWLNPVGSFEKCCASLDTPKIDDDCLIGPHRTT